MTKADKRRLMKAAKRVAEGFPWSCLAIAGIEHEFKWSNLSKRYIAFYGGPKDSWVDDIESREKQQLVRSLWILLYREVGDLNDRK